MNRKTKLVVST